MVYRVVHKTVYSYESYVSASYGQVYLLPRNTPGQRVLSTSVEIDPLPDNYAERDDFFGNRAAHFAVLDAHTTLSVTASSRVEVFDKPTYDLQAGPTWEQARSLLANRDWSDPQVSDPDVVDARQFILDSKAAPIDPSVIDFAQPVFGPDRPLLDVLSGLTSHIYKTFEYKSGVTTLETVPAKLLELGKGVCQDFAHLGIASLRAMGIPARYVSGYLETIPPPGKEKLQGADVSHAWLSAFVPTIGWVDVDPTNNLFVGSRHVTLAWGRDFSDVSPLKGVIFTEAKSNTMKVTVDVNAE